MNRRGKRRAKVARALTHRAIHLLGVMAVVPLVAVDPAMVVLLFDVEFLALLGTVGVGMLRGDAQVLWLRLRNSQFVAELRVAITLTRERPRSLMEC